VSGVVVDKPPRKGLLRRLFSSRETEDVSPSSEAVRIEPGTGVSAVPSRDMVTGTLSPAQLQKVVQTACGALARRIQIVMQPDRSLSVKVQAVNAAAERSLTDTLLRIPELSGPGVRLEIEVGP
jgi:hypothetical protein